MSDSNQQKTRVLIVGQTPPPIHGQSVMMDRLVRSRMDTVELVHVRMAFSKSNDEVGRFQINKITELASVILRIWWVRLTQRIDIFYYPPAGPNRIPIYRDIAILICTRWLFAKTVFHMHASGGSELCRQLRGASRFLARLAYNQPDAVIRLSEHTVDDATNFEAKREFLVANCAEDEFDRFTKSSGPRNQTAGDTLQLLYLGTVCMSKGILDLLDACHQLRQRNVPFHLHVVGGFQPNAFGDEVHQQIAAFNLGDHVTLHGQLTGDEKYTQFATADVFCFPTFYESEGFPCVVLEAMSFQLPVVATRWRGIRSIVQHEKTGYLIDPHDTAALADVLERLATDASLRQAWSQAGREQYLALYTIEKHIARMEQVFQAVARDMDLAEAAEPLVASQ